MIKLFIFSISFLFFFNNISISKNNIYISLTIDDQIITNYDIEKESDYLKILNPNLSQINEKNLLQISKESLIRELIKKSEIKKVFDFNKKNEFVDEYLKNFYKRLNFENETEFQNYLLNSSKHSLEEIKEKLKVEILWNELIYLKYANQLNIDKTKLAKKIDKIPNEVVKEYQLSEIAFKRGKNEDFDELINRINSSIEEVGFNNTANIFSISDSAKFGGKIGWVNENNLSEIILINLRNLNEGEKTKIIQVGNNNLILKVDKIRYKNIIKNKEDELEKMIKFETNKQLNQFSKIFFDKSKINYNINEK